MIPRAATRVLIVRAPSRVPGRRESGEPRGAAPLASTARLTTTSIAIYRDATRYDSSHDGAVMNAKHTQEERHDRPPSHPRRPDPSWVAVDSTDPITATRAGDHGPRLDRGPAGTGFGPASAGRMPFMGRSRSTRRGEIRTAILALLLESPMHGYQIITELSDRSGGDWRPSAGSVYPTLQQLTDEGLVRDEERDGRRVYELTESGRAEASEVAGATPPWQSRRQGRQPGPATRRGPGDVGHDAGRPGRRYRRCRPEPTSCWPTAGARCTGCWRTTTPSRTAEGGLTRARPGRGDPRRSDAMIGRASGSSRQSGEVA